MRYGMGSLQKKTICTETSQPQPPTTRALLLAGYYSSASCTSVQFLHINPSLYHTALKPSLVPTFLPHSLKVFATTVAHLFSPRTEVQWSLISQPTGIFRYSANNNVFHHHHYCIPCSILILGISCSASTLPILQCRRYQFSLTRKM